MTYFRSESARGRSRHRISNQTGGSGLTFIPISALDGDNVVTHSQNMPWYGGATLLWHLENAYVASDRNLIDPRFPVQYVIRPMSRANPDYRGYAGLDSAGVPAVVRIGP